MAYDVHERMPYRVGICNDGTLGEDVFQHYLEAIRMAIDEGAAQKLIDRLVVKRQPVTHVHPFATRHRHGGAPLPKLDEHLGVANLRAVGGQRITRRRIQVLARPDREPAAVAGALHLIVIDDVGALAEQTEGVRADVRGRQHLTTDVVERDRLAVEPSGRVVLRGQSTPIDLYSLVGDAGMGPWADRRTRPATTRTPGWCFSTQIQRFLPNHFFQNESSSFSFRTARQSLTRVGSEPLTNGTWMAPGQVSAVTE